MKKKAKRKYFKDEVLLINIGNKIKEIRLIKNFTQEFLANESEVDYSQISRMERGKVNFSISHLSKVAHALGIDPKELLP